MTDHTPTDHGRDQDDEYGYSADIAAETGVDAAPGTLPLVGGAVLVLSAARSLLRGQLRSVPIGAAGVGLLGYGLRKRREEGNDGLQTDLETFSGDADEADDSSAIEFVDDEDTSMSSPRSKPDIDADADDPRRNTADDERIEIDVSESATMGEASEATGPDPEQAQPAQTEATEPEATPAEDAQSTDEREGDAGDESGDVTTDEETDEERATDGDADETGAGGDEDGETER